MAGVPLSRGTRNHSCLPQSGISKLPKVKISSPYFIGERDVKKRLVLLRLVDKET